MNRLIYRVLSGKSGVRFEIQILIRQTAKAVGMGRPETKEFSAPELLRVYAQLTVDVSKRAAQGEYDSKLLHRKLYHMAYRLGNSVRLFLRPQNKRECLAVIRLLYRNIGIQIGEESPGIFCVRKCYFSDFYTPEICSIISAIDQGIFAGVYHGGNLVFRERITEGEKVCRAEFK